MHVTHHTCTLRTAAACVLCVCDEHVARRPGTSHADLSLARPPLDSSLAPEGPGALADTECL